jgi:hypothetical protein
MLKRARSMFFTKPIATELAESAKAEGSPLQSVLPEYDLLQRDSDAGRREDQRDVLRQSLVLYVRAHSDGASDRALYADAQGVEGRPICDAHRAERAGRRAARPTIARMLAGFTAAKRAIKRTDGLEFAGLRKARMHIQRADRRVPSAFSLSRQRASAARALVKRWLEYFPEVTDARAQNIRPVDGDDSSLRELFKYFTKLVANRKLMPAKALDVIFRAMRGRRVYQPVGFTVATDTTTKASWRRIKGRTH